MIPEDAEVAAVNVRSAENIDAYLGHEIKDYYKDYDAFWSDLKAGKITAKYLITDSHRFRKMEGIEEYVSPLPHKVCGTYWLVALPEK